MGLTEIRITQPFYFRSYDRVIGVAADINELRQELGRLSQENPTALQYHLKQGHIVQWLESSNEKKLAEQLKGVDSISEARRRVASYLKRKSKSK